LGLPRLAVSTIYPDKSLMRLRHEMLCISLLVLIGCGADDGASATAAAPPRGAAPDLGAIAASVVRSMRVQEGDAVLVSGSVRDLELLEDIVIEVQKAGGHPLLSIGSERIVRRSYDDVPAQYDTLAPQWTRIVSQEVDVIITVDAVETPDLLAHVPQARLQARSRANQPFNMQLFQRGVRSTELGNGMYPTHARAARFGLTRDELARYFWDGLATDPDVLRQRADRIRPVLAQAREVRVTHPNGTDLTLRLDVRDIYVNDGAISDSDLASGGIDVVKYLPAGEIYARVMPGSANGRVVVDHLSFQGRDIQGLTLDIANGVITSMNAPDSGEALLAAYGNEKDGREQLTVFDIGLNPGIPAEPGSRVLAYMPAGMVTLFFGADFWAGGANASAFTLNPHLAGTTVTIDGRVVVENGSLKL
jgi:aminopeptidase